MKKIHIVIQTIFHIQVYDLENEVKVTKISQACHSNIDASLKKFHPLVQRYASSKSMTLKSRSRSPKSNKFLGLLQ